MSSADEYPKAELEALRPNGPVNRRERKTLRTALGMGISPFYGDKPREFILGALEDLCADLDDLVDHINDDDPTPLRNGVDRLHRRACLALALIPRLEAAAQKFATEESVRAK